MFAAASMKNALDSANAAYTAQSGKQITVSYAASSALAKQIESGAPADIFISADTDWMAYLGNKNLLKPDTQVNLLGNQIVLVAPATKRSRLISRPAWISPPSSATVAWRWARSIPCQPVNTARQPSKNWGSGRRSKARLPVPKACALRWRWYRAAKPLRNCLSDGCRLRPGRRHRRHFSSRQPPAHHLSARHHCQQQEQGCRCLLRLPQVVQGGAFLRARRFHHPELNIACLLHDRRTNRERERFWRDGI